MNTVQNETDDGPEENALEDTETSSLGHGSIEKDDAPATPTRHSAVEDEAGQAAQLNGASFATFPEQDTEDDAAGSVESSGFATPS